MLPVGENAEAQKLSALLFDKFGGEVCAFLAELGGIDVALLLAQHFNHLVLDWQPVAVPTGNVGRGEAFERLVAQNYVLQNLVERGADVDVAVREGGAVVEDEFGVSRVLFLNAPVEVGLFPVFDARGFAFDEVAAHGELCVGKVEGVFEVFFRHFVVCLNLS